MGCTCFVDRRSENCHGRVPKEREKNEVGVGGGAIHLTVVKPGVVTANYARLN